VRAAAHAAQTRAAMLLLSSRGGVALLALHDCSAAKLGLPAVILSEDGISLLWDLWAPWRFRLLA